MTECVTRFNCYLFELIHRHEPHDEVTQSACRDTTRSYMYIINMTVYLSWKLFYCS